MKTPNTFGHNVNAVGFMEPEVLLHESNDQLSYHEMAETPVQKLDPLLMLSENLDELELIQTKMSFLFREIKYLLKV